MNTFNKIVIFLLLLSFSFTACEDMLEADSERIVLADDNDIKIDSLYSMFGILSRLQKVADSYVILGELRGDLLEPTENANKYLKEIYNFDSYSEDNPYANNLSSYYEVINNCNYVINNIDTTKIVKGEKPMYRTMAAAKSIRAWTYMQIALNYGKAVYFEKPLMNINDASKEYPSLTFDDLAGKLIDDLLPFKNVGRLELGSFGGLYTSDLFISIPFLLGDLYLWTGKYLEAATMYRNLMYDNYYLISSTYQDERGISGTGANKTFSGTLIIRWFNIFRREASSELISAIAASNEYEQNSELNDLFAERNSYHTENVPTASLVPSKKAINNFDSAVYFIDYHVENQQTYTISGFGDSRGYSSIYAPYKDYSMYEQYDALKDASFVYKYMLMNQEQYSSENYGQPEKTANMIMIHRVGLLYLRYAEAVNRLGKPNLAMAVLKYGLKSATLANNRYIPPKEKEYGDYPDYMDFTDLRFNNNIGLRTRGLGLEQVKDTTVFIIKVNKPDGELPTLSDSIQYMENLIQEELALETAFEGNRFHDLMRLAIHRDDNAYLANIVASRYNDEATRNAMRIKLMDRQRWYLNK